MKKKIILGLAICFALIGTKVYATCDGIEFEGVEDDHIYCLGKNPITWWAAFAWCEHQGRHLASLQEACAGWAGATKDMNCPNMKITNDVYGNNFGNTYMWTASPNGSSNAFGVYSANGTTNGSFARSAERRPLCY